MSKPSGPTFARVLVVARGQRHLSHDHLAGHFAGEVLTAEDVPSAAERARAASPGLILLGEGDDVAAAVRALKGLRSLFPHAPVGVIADRPTVDAAVALVRAGACDYLPGPLDQAALDRLRASAGVEPPPQGQQRFFCESCPASVAVVGRSRAMAETMQTVRLVAESNCNPVLILGETGTGKELAARAVHALRCADGGRFVAVNCAALTASLLESELFGHVKGSFTGADRDKQGLFEAAAGGAIFLDEISEMPLGLQAKLLRVVQDEAFRRVGGTEDIVSRTTIIASSNRDLLSEVRQGSFRRDLYYRLAVFPITMPPLRCDDRRRDIPLLAEYFLRTSAIPRKQLVRGLSAAARKRLMQHDWPGNVRELRNVIDRALILEKSQEIQPASILIEPPADRAAGSSPDGAASPEDFSLETAEREFILRALKETGWQRTRAAALLGITRATLHAKLKRYDIQAPGRRRPPGKPAMSSAGK